MLAIRLQRLGRKGLSVYRLAVQDARWHPGSGKVVAYVGSFDPHQKTMALDNDKIKFYLENGAQPSSRVVGLLKSQKIKLPGWVKGLDGGRQSSVRHPDKLRKNRPAAEDKPAEAAKEDAKTAPSETESSSSETNQPAA